MRENRVCCAVCCILHGWNTRTCRLRHTRTHPRTGGLEYMCKSHTAFTNELKNSLIANHESTSSLYVSVCVCAIVLNGLPTAALKLKWNKNRRGKNLWEDRSRVLLWYHRHCRRCRHRLIRHCPVCKHLACTDKYSPHIYFFFFQAINSPALKRLLFLKMKNINSNSYGMKIRNTLTAGRWRMYAKLIDERTSANTHTHTRSREDEKERKMMFKLHTIHTNCFQSFLFVDVEAFLLLWSKDLTSWCVCTEI